MRPSLALATLLLATAAAPLAAQEIRKLPTQPVLETVQVTAFDIRDVSATPPRYRLAAMFSGLAPSHYQISKYSDFRDAAWTVWPTTTSPAWSGAIDGGCGTNIFKVVGFFRVRAWRASTQTFTVSNVVRDTVCMFAS